MKKPKPKIVSRHTLHGDPHAADPPSVLGAVADAVLAYRPKSKQKKARKRKKANRGKS